jgi:hypothetical protein
VEHGFRGQNKKCTYIGAATSKRKFCRRSTYIHVWRGRVLSDISLWPPSRSGKNSTAEMQSKIWPVYSSKMEQVSFSTPCVSWKPQPSSAISHEISAGCCRWGCGSHKEAGMSWPDGKYV